MKDSIAMTLMMRIDLIKDKVDDLSDTVKEKIMADEQTGTRITNLETASITMTDTLHSISADLQDIKNGPVYSLDKYITRKVATYTMGMGGFGAVMWALANILFQ